jgi:hypothetical protein
MVHVSYFVTCARRNEPQLARRRRSGDADFALNGELPFMRDTSCSASARLSFLPFPSSVLEFWLTWHDLTAEWVRAFEGQACARLRYIWSKPVLQH